ncbi:MAG: DUF4012 domain-containing protein [Candidatus Shapirobacteria bacterium]
MPETIPLPPVIIKPKRKLFPILLSIFLVFLAVVALIFTIGFFTFFVPGKKLYSQVIQAKTIALELKTAAENKDLVLAQTKISSLKTQVLNIQKSYKGFSYLRSLPYAKDYYRDGQMLLSAGLDGLDTGEILIKAIEPYQDFLGVKGSATDSAKTTEDRIAFLTETAEGLIPHLDSIEGKLSNIENSLNQIDISRYPTEYKGQKIHSTFLKAKETLAEVHKFVKDGRPILTKTSWLLGKDTPRNYLLIFQNDAELRPTGGFWTAYGTIKVDKGKISPGISSDIYTLDAKFNSTIPAPRPIKAYHINVPYWNIRDLNLSPDFPTSIQLFLEKYQKYSGSKDKVDAVIALDTQVLVDMVKVLGRVGVPGFGNFSADPDKRCDGCPQIIYQLEWLAGQPRNYLELNRKGFLGPLMHSLLSNAMGAEKSKIAPLAEGLINNVLQKHMLFYFSDPEIQAAGVLANISGSITETNPNTDYFHLNDANMSSAKTNLFLIQKIKHEIISKDGIVEHQVTVTYTNPSKASNCNLEKGDLCLNAPKYRDWFRFYVPKGSKFIKMTGSEVEPVLYEELGKQVFEGFYGDKYPLYAQSSAKVSIQYQTSVPASSNYTLYLQKQPGTKPIEYELIVNKQKQTFNWVSDKIIKLAL